MTSGNFDFVFKKDGNTGKILQYKIALNPALSTDLAVNYTGSVKFNLPPLVKALGTFRLAPIEFAVPVYGVPVPVIITNSLTLLPEATASGKFSISFKTNYNSTIGASYSTDGGWQNLASSSYSGSCDKPLGSYFDIKVDGDLGLKLALESKLYDADNLKSTFFVTCGYKVNVDKNTHPNIKVNINAGIGANAEAKILKYNLGKCELKQDFTLSEIYSGDFGEDSLIISKFSGDNQIGKPSTNLNLPVKVRVLNSSGIPQKNISVTFNVTQGDGTLNTPNTTTDADGYAQTYWKMGSNFSIQKVEAIAKKSSGSIISGSPIEFVATIGDSTVTDVDGNVYHIVIIGKQWWLKENLKTIHYNNGDAIPNLQDTAQWNNTKAGAWCEYNNNSAYGDVYGKLYNYLAVVDNRKLAPKGWHIPSKTEWETLRDNLGGPYYAGGKMKEVGNKHWSGSNTGADNSSGFTALPGGIRSTAGTSYFRVGELGDWLSSTKANNLMCIGVYILYDESYLAITETNIFAGYSVRCIKD